MAARLFSIGLCVGLTAFAASAAEPAEAATVSAAPGSVGYDISFPQCTANSPRPPSNASFTIVGVTGGTALSPNPCLQQQYTAASTAGVATGLYVNTGNPGPSSKNWPAAGTLTPANCLEIADANDPGCAYDYGWAAGTNAAQAQGIDPTGRIWWLDVEQQNSWDGNATANTADIQGEMDALYNAGAQEVGIYSTALQWDKITGSYTQETNDQPAWAAYFTPTHPLAQAPLWIPTGSLDVYKAYQACGESFTGAKALLTQYLVQPTPTTGLDADLVCGGAVPVSIAGAPRSPVAKAGKKRGTVSLSWQAPTSNGGEPITGYVIYRGTAGGHLSAYQTVSCTASSCSWTDSGAKHGKRYYYKVAAVTEVGTGHQSTYVTTKGK